MSEHYKAEWPWLNLYEPFPELSGYRPVLGSRGMVSSPHFFASAAGLEVLKNGGNAVDAAIATSAMLMVVCPMQCGPGGDAFWLISAPGEEVSCLNGAGYSPKAASADALRERGLVSIGARSVFSVTVPGAVDGWAKAHARYGSVPLSHLLEPAARCAEEGFAASRHTAASFALAGDLLSEKGALNLYARGGRVPGLYEPVRPTGLAAALREIGRTAGRSLYEGDLALAIAQTCRELGGWLTYGDLASYQSKWVAPLSGGFRGYDVYTAPPPSQGFGLLAALRAIETQEAGPLPVFSPDTSHLLIEAAAFALDLRDRHNGAHLERQVALNIIRSADVFEKEFSPEEHLNREAIAVGSRKGDTAHLAVVDGNGLGVSLIQSLFFDFGSCIPVHAGGFTLQNRGAAFSLIPGHPGELRPGVQPPHTLMPTIVRRGGDLHLVMGCMGGDGQMQTQLQLMIDLIDGGLDPQQAISRSRWYLERGKNVRLLVEEGPTFDVRELRNRGHEVVELGRFEEIMGHAQVIEVQDNGVLVGGCDPRSDGQVAGL